MSVNVKEDTQLNIQLRDLSGRIILSEDHNGSAGLSSYEMELENFAKGVYMLEVKSANESWKVKVAVE